MKKTKQWIIGFLLVLLAPISAKAQWSFDVGSVEAYINDHKQQRSLLLARSTLEYSNRLLHEYSKDETTAYKEINVELDKYTRAFDVIDMMYQSLRTALNVYSTYEGVSERIADYKTMLNEFNPFHICVREPIRLRRCSVYVPCVHMRFTNFSRSAISFKIGRAHV